VFEKEADSFFFFSFESFGERFLEAVVGLGPFFSSVLFYSQQGSTLCGILDFLRLGIHFGFHHLYICLLISEKIIV
jgi:hypothetical protein